MNLEFLPDVPIADSWEVDGVIFDYAKDQRVVAIEILDASTRNTNEVMEIIDFGLSKSGS